MGTYQPIILTLAFVITSQAISTRREELKFIYPERIHSERDLSVCLPNEVCSIIHRRFWIRPVIDRLCRCPTGQQCPWKWTWSNEIYDQTMALSNRSQMKFCGSIADLPDCEAEQQAAVIAPFSDTDRKPRNKSKINTPTRESVNITCRCQGRKYWEMNAVHDRNATSQDLGKSFRCTEVKKCRPMGFCGNVRSDYFSTYYRCSCPVGHMCLYRNRTTYNVTELLYSGPAYQAVCIPNAM